MGLPSSPLQVLWLHHVMTSAPVTVSACSSMHDEASAVSESAASSGLPDVWFRSSDKVNGGTSAGVVHRD
jgi:hypothetical protein